MIVFDATGKRIGILDRPVPDALGFALLAETPLKPLGVEDVSMTDSEPIRLVSFERGKWRVSGHDHHAVRVTGGHEHIDDVRGFRRISEQEAGEA